MERYLRVNLLGPGPCLMKKEFTGPRSHKGWETLHYITFCFSISACSTWVTVTPSSVGCYPGNWRRYCLNRADNHRSPLDHLPWRTARAVRCDTVLQFCLPNPSAEHTAFVGRGYRVEPPSAVTVLYKGKLLYLSLAARVPWMAYKIIRLVYHM